MSSSWNSVHPEMRWFIEDVARQVRGRRWMRAAGRFGWIAFALTALFTVIMWLGGASGLAGLILTGLYVASLLAGIVYVVVPVLRHPVTLEQVALFIDERHPELENRVASVIDLSLHEKEGVSTWLTEKFFEESLQRVRETSIADMTDPKPMRNLGLNAIAIGLSSLILLYLSSSVWLPAFSFVMPPGTAQLAALPFTVEPGDVRVRVGDNQLIWVRTTDTDREVTVRWRQAGGSWEDVPAAPSGTERVYYHEFSDVRQDMEYQVQSGRKRSEVFQITAWIPPTVDSINLTYHYPEYLQLPARETPNSGNIAAVEGTNVDVEVYTNKPVAQAEMVFESGARLPLARLDGTRWRVPVAVTQDDAYEIQLKDDDGEANEFPARYTIAMHRDKAPEIKISFPRGDNDVNSLEEVPFDFTVSDDYGFGAFGVQYEIAGREPVRIPLNEGATLATGAEGHHQLHLEDLGLEVGDFITWSVWAEDTKPNRGDYESTGDPYFLEVRPFKREYREAVSAGGMPGGGQPENELDKVQKEILIATWNLRRESKYMDKAEFTEKRGVIVDTQQELVERVSQAGGPLEAPDPDELKLREAMQGSTDALTRAELPEPKAALSEATVHQQNALRLLARMKPRDAQVQQQQGGGGGGGGQSDRPDISELEMARNRNFYEQENVTREQQQVNDEVLNRIKELAQRQQHINEELAKLISELQLAKSEEERERLMKELEKLQEEMRSNLERADQARQDLTSNAMNNEQTRDAQESLDRARHQMNRSLELLDREDLQQARSAGSRASDALEDVQDQLEQFGRSAAAQRMRELQDQMRGLRDRQQEIVDQAQQAQQMHQSPSMDQQKQLDEIQQGLAQEKDKLAEDFVEMMDEASELAERGAQTQELMSRRLGDWMRETAREGIYEEIHESKPYVDYGIWDSAVSEERKIAEKLDRAGDKLQAVADSLVENDLEGMQKALEHLDRLLQRDEVARALEQRDQEAEQGAAGQSDAESEKPGEGQTPDENGDQPGSARAEDESGKPGQGRSPTNDSSERRAESEPGQQPGDQPGDQQPGQQPGEQPGQQTGQGQPSPSQTGQRPSPSGQQGGSRQAGAQRGADGSWAGADSAMRDFIERGYEDWLDELNDAESLLPQGTPVRTEVTRVRERIEMMRREWRARALAPQYDLFLEHTARPLAEAAEELQREIAKQLDAQEFLAVDEGQIPDRYRARVGEYFKRLSEAEGRP